MAATTKLIVWNDALREIGGHPLVDTTTVNTQQDALNGAWDHAVEYVLSRRDWNFARRRASLTGTSDGSFPPYTFRFTRPSDYLRKVWLKSSADNEFQIEHAESGAVIYALTSTALLEYISDHADNYDPANWPPQFTRAVVIYLAMLVAPKLARAGHDDAKIWYEKLDLALGEAARIESVTTINASISTDRAPVLRRALEILGQQVSGSVPDSSDADAMRWQMNRGWDTSVKYVLEQAPWSFAQRRAQLVSTADSSGFPPYTFRYDRPSGYLKKVWIRETTTDAFEADYAESGIYFYGYAGTKVMQYIAYDSSAQAVANWPAAFAECVSLYMAAQLASTQRTVETQDGPRRQPMSARDAIMSEFVAQLERAIGTHAIELHTASIAANRMPVMRRALEIMGQMLAGYGATYGKVAELRWQMNLGWDHALKFVLSQGAWNFAAKRAVLQSGDEGDDNIPTTATNGLLEGYSVEPASTDTDDPPAISGFTYSYPLPTDFVHKIWIKADVNNDYECAHQQLGGYMFIDHDPAVMEYVAMDSYTSEPDNWPVGFTEAMAAYLAWHVAPELTVQVAGRGAKVAAAQLPMKLEQQFKARLSDAKLRDAIQQEPKTIPLGRFARARFGSIGTTSIRRYN